MSIRIFGLKQKTTVSVFILFLMQSFCFFKTVYAQESDKEAATTVETNKTNQSFKAGEKSFSFLFTMGPILTVNTESTTKSAPSPIAFSCGFGAKLNKDKNYSFEPRVSFFKNYYLWDGNKALPAEIENRTATVLSFLFDLPFVYNFKKKDSYYFEAGGGIAMLARYGILSNGVKSSDSGASGDAAGDVKEINSWLLKPAHMFFPELTGAWNYKVSERLTAGLEGRIYIPISGNLLDTMMVSIAARFMF